MKDLKTFRRVILDTFNRRELTIYPVGSKTINGWETTVEAAAVDKHSLSETIEIPIGIAKFLIEKNILVEDSGSFESNETHYTLSRDSFMESTEIVFSFIETFGDWNMFHILVKIARDRQTDKLLTNK